MKSKKYVKKSPLKINPINRMDLSDDDTEKYDNLMDKIDREIRLDKEMKFSNKTLINLLQNLKIDLRSENNSLNDIESYLEDIIYTLNSLKKIL